MVVFLSIIRCKFQEFKLHGFREIEFFLGGCFLMPHPVYSVSPPDHIKRRIHYSSEKTNVFTRRDKTISAVSRLDISVVSFAALDRRRRRLDECVSDS